MTQQPPQPVHYAPSSPRRRGRIAAGIIGGLVGLCLVGTVIGVLAGGDEQESPTGAATTVTTPTTTAQVSAPVAQEQPAAQATTKPAAPAKKWTTVATLSGSANKRGPVWHLGDGQARLTYTVKGGQYPTVAIYVVPEGKSLTKDGGIPEVMATAAGGDTTELANEAGRYYLDVQAANATWTVTVQELR